MNEDTTTTTTEDQDTTTTTTEVADTTATTTVEKQGEVKVDKKAKAKVLGGDKVNQPEADAKAQAANIEDAKQTALANHRDHVGSQPEQARL